MFVKTQGTVTSIGLIFLSSLSLLFFLFFRFCFFSSFANLVPVLLTNDEITASKSSCCGTDNCSVMKKSEKLLNQLFPYLRRAPCASHMLNNAFKDIIRLESVDAIWSIVFC